MKNNEFDPRIVRVGIEVNGAIKTYENVYLSASGTKYANSNQNEAEVNLVNLDTDTRNFILTETSPFNKNRTQKKVYVYAGRKSYGTFLVYSGNIITSVPSQPADIWLTLKCLTGNYQKGNIVARNKPATATLKDIATQIASDIGSSLNFQATDKQIGNYTFTGSALKQIDKLGEMGSVRAYQDNDTLTVQDMNVPLNGKIQKVNLTNGMIGLPDITEQGIKVKILLNPDTALGGILNVTSKINPSANGNYLIYKLGFDIANRDIPFYWIVEGKRI